MQNGYEIDELHDVSASSPTDLDILQYKSSSALWTKASIANAGIAATIHTHSQSQVTNLVTDLGTINTAVTSAQSTATTANTTATNAVPKSTVTTKGDIIAATGASAVSRLGVGTDGYILTARSTSSTGLTWEANAGGGGGGVSSVAGTSPIISSGTTAITLSIQSASTSAAGAVQLSDSTSTTSSVLAATPTAVKSAYDLANLAVTNAGFEASSFGAAGVIATHPRFNLTVSGTVTAGTIFHTKIIPHKTMSVSNISFTGVGNSGGTMTLCRFGIYTRSGTTFTLAVRTASDTSIFSVSNTKYTRALDTTGGYPASYTMTAGSEYWVSFIQVGAAASLLVGTGRQSVAANSATGGQQYSQASQSDLVTSSTGTISATGGGYYAEVY